jgi:hypothetical protein
VPWRLYFVAEPRQRFAIGQLQPALSALQSLDVGLFVDRQDHRILRWLQIEPDDVGSLLRETGIGADAPAAAPCQRDLVPAQDAPDLMPRDVAQMPGQQGSVPASITRRRWLIQSRQNPPLVRGLVMGRLAAARRIRQTGQAVSRKAAPPFADHRGTRPQPHRHCLVAQPLGHRQDHRRPKRHAPLGLSGGLPRPQGRTFLAGQHHFCRSHRGRLPYPLTYPTRY